MAHLTGLGSACHWKKIATIHLEDADCSAFSIERYSGKSPTWLRSSLLVNDMLDAIRKERDEPWTHPNAFNIIGDRSVFLDGATKFLALKEDVEAESKEVQELENIQSSDPERWDHLQMLLEYQDGKKFHKSTPYWKYDVWDINQRGHLGDALGLFLNKVGNSAYFKFWDWKMQHAIRQEKPILELMQKHCVVLWLNPNNCFTWARKKLEMIQVTMVPKCFDRIAAVTGKYVKPIQTRTEFTIEEVEQDFLCPKDRKK